MKSTLSFKGARFALAVLTGYGLSLSLLSSVRAQQQQQQEQIAVVELASVGEDPTHDRIMHARALAAVGKLTAAATELEALRASSEEESVREVARILLMGIYVQMPDYARANALLDEAFNARAAQSETTMRSYYALAGQTVNSVREHVDRYRIFGLNIADENLPSEARNDLEQMRALLERVIEQAKEIRSGDERAKTLGRGADATALIEETANVRLRLGRSQTDRALWRKEISDARQRLFATETRIAKISDAPVKQQSAASAASPNAAPSIVAAAPNTATQNAQPAKDRVRQPGKPGALSEHASSFVAPVAEAKASADAKADGMPLSVGALLHAKVDKKIAPSYPSLARSARIEGVVVVHVVVDEKGSVISVERAEGPLQLQTAAADAIRRWKFKPTIIDGKAVRVSGYISFNFTL